MYKKYVPDNDYSECIEDNMVYKCRKDIKCDNGVFESGSLVMLQVCNSDLERIYVIDFTSVCIRVKNNPFECDYLNQIKIDNLWDVAAISVNMMSDYFERADEVNQDLKKVKKFERKIIVVAFMLAILFWILFFFFILAFNISVEAILFMIALIVFDVGEFIFIVTAIKKVHSKFCDFVISCSDYKLQYKLLK